MDVDGNKPNAGDSSSPRVIRNVLDLQWVSRTIDIPYPASISGLRALRAPNRKAGIQ
jgi:hypothetical protein